ncbi:DNA translocase FtsK [Psychrobacter aestuarii]|uniref:DNA translocase FtsK n=1 Tax=Psychrobacter aestuarii TaxID=556327 RepID=A0ABP3F7Z8_9GAMM
MISAPIIEYLRKGIFTFLGLMLAVYVFVILLTYTSNDPSWSHISSDMTTINNMGGAMGAWLSDLGYRFFGFAAWWLLAFLIYEPILIWWHTRRTFWLLRVVGYLFLLLSASAWLSQLWALLPHASDLSSTPFGGAYGGIIGMELQSRLAALLTPWGTLIFLSLFVAIVTTFAFNIHWREVYRTVINLKWVNLGLSHDDGYGDALSDHEDSERSAASKRSSAAKSSTNDGTGEQLSFELAPNTGAGNDRHAELNERFGGVLSEFLSKSGLQDYAKDLARAPVSSTAAASAETKRPVSSAADAAPVRKVEPSFAWNDTKTVDALLSKPPYDDAALPQASSEVQTPAAQADATPEAPAAMPRNQNAEAEQTARTKSAVTPEASKPSQPAQPVQQPATNDAPAEAQRTEAIDALAGQWLAEHDAAPQSVEPTPAAESTSSAAATSAATSATKSATKWRIETEATEADAPVLDMTPSNTPPAKPDTPPTVAQSETPAARTAPDVRFAVPEGDASNQIAGMFEDESDEYHLPDIHDDAAFATRSRAMQTAKYRANLSPIPELSILDQPDPNRQPSYTAAELEQLSELLEIKLQEFNVKAEVVNAIPGPVVTRFEVALAAGVKASKVTGISRDLARSLSMASLRVVEVIPGKPYIGIEVPNKQREMVRLVELLNTDKYKDPKAQVSMAMGKDIGGKPIITDLARAPHMLVAGTTGSGKSVLVNAMLLSILLKYTPDELRLILIDPKQLELANYNEIPHLLTPVVTDMTEAASSLSWCVAEMERRYQLMSLLKVRKLNEFNKKVRAAEKAGKPLIDPLWRPNDSVSMDKAPKLKTLPIIVIVADEFADMIMQVGKQAEELITRLAQKSRAAGIHLMLATQRPSVDVITGLIKANIPVRAALRVNSKVDSRTILDSGGAEDMLGNGDMLFLGPGQIEPDRVHGAYVSDEEVNRVCDAWRERGAPDYIDNMAGNFELTSPSGGSTANNASGEDDDLYNDAVAFVMETRKVSASSIQRKFSIGYNRAARIVDSMEEAGLVSSMGKSGKRELLV